MGIEFDGFDELQDELENLKNTAQELDGENEIPFDELFPEPWMQHHTDHESFDGLIEASDWEVETQEDFEAIPEDEWDDYIQENTVFKDWHAMYKQAAEDWVKRQF